MPSRLSFSLNEPLPGLPYAYEFNDLREETSERKPTGWSGCPPAVPGRALVQSCRFYPDMAQNEGLRPSVLKTKLSVHFGAWSSVMSFTDNESPLAILYSSPPAVLFFPFGSAELSWVPLHYRKCINSLPCMRRTYHLRIIGSPTPGRVCEPCNR
jgi:hypothetical protein